MNQYKIDFASVDWDVPTAGVRQKVVVKNDGQFRLLEFSKDFVELDWCTKGHIGYILDGQLEIDFNGKSILYGPGDVAIIPDGNDHKHKAKSVTDKVTIFVVETT
jgi:quercetin dioxygenase-like cupin family protein